MSKFLVMHNDTKKIFKCSKCALKDEISLYFDILVDDFDFQIWDKDFEEWVVWDSKDDIPSNSKLKVVSSSSNWPNYV